MMENNYALRQALNTSNLLIEKEERKLNLQELREQIKLIDFSTFVGSPQHAQAVL